MNFEQIFRALNQERVEFVLIGGFAAALHGSSIVTHDIDVCIRFSRENLLALQNALAAAHPKHRITPQRIPLEITERNWMTLKNLHLETDWGTVDCLGDVLGLGGFDQVSQFVQVMKTKGGDIRVLSIDGLIKAKEATARPHDIQTVAQLKAIQSKRS